MKLSSAPRDGTPVEIRVFIYTPEQHPVGPHWVPAHYDGAAYEWVYKFKDTEHRCDDSRVDGWRPLGMTARIASKQASVGDDWVITNGDPEFFVGKTTYWVMPRGGQRSWRPPLLVTAMEIFDPEDEKGWLIGATWDESKKEAKTFTITPKDVWAVKLGKCQQPPNVAEPQVYEPLS